MSDHILIVDDDREIRDLVARFLETQGYRVSTARDGAEMKRVLETANIALIVLDLMLPGVDGLTLARDLRAARKDVPIIMLTAMGEETDRIIGLEMGADDYLSKPFNPRELLARIKAVLRRARVPASAGVGVYKVTFEGWVLDIHRRELHSPKGVLVPLSAGEYDLLKVLVTHAQRVLSRDQLLDMARGRDAQPFDRSIDVQISRLRKKIETDPKDPRRIKTVRGGGYVFTPETRLLRAEDPPTSFAGGEGL